MKTDKELIKIWDTKTYSSKNLNNKEKFRLITILKEKEITELKKSLKKLDDCTKAKETIKKMKQEIKELEEIKLWEEKVDLHDKIVEMREITEGHKALFYTGLTMLAIGVGLIIILWFEKIGIMT